MAPGWGAPSWGGRSFSDSIAAFNPWTKARRALVVQDLEPTAPFDRVDQASGGSVLGAEALAPEEERGAGAGEVGPTALRSDWLPPRQYPRTFPGDGDELAAAAASPIVPLADRGLVAAADKLRLPGLGRAADNYPLVAPGDRTMSSRQRADGWLYGSAALSPWVVASSDDVDEKFARYFDQVHGREQRRVAGARLAEAYAAADLDKDGTVSREEYDKLVGRGGQNKTAEEVERLWAAHHAAGGQQGLSKAEFNRLSRAGFDLGDIDRPDISSVFSLPGGPRLGFWGSGARCPAGTYVVGVRLKVMPLAGPKADDTALNAVGLRCSGGKEVSTVEGPDGRWTRWARCPAGQQVFSARARSQAYAAGRDNAGVASLELGCRRPDLGAMARLRFADEAGIKRTGVVVGVGPTAKGGGWTKEFMCGPASAVCGAQAHVVRDQGRGDDMGVTKLRLYCCSTPVDCTTACGPPGGERSMGCKVCRMAVGRAEAAVAVPGALQRSWTPDRTGHPAPTRPAS